MAFQYQPQYTQQRKKQKYMIMIFAAVIIITLAVLGFGFFRDTIVNFLKIIPPKEEALVPPKEIKIDFELLDSETLKNLQPFLQILPFGGKAGRPEPFSPPAALKPNPTPNPTPSPTPKK